MGIRKKVAETTYAASRNKENTKAEKGYKTTFTMFMLQCKNQIIIHYIVLIIKKTLSIK